MSDSERLARDAEELLSGSEQLVSDRQGDLNGSGNLVHDVPDPLKASEGILNGVGQPRKHSEHIAHDAEDALDDGEDLLGHGRVVAMHTSHRVRGRSATAETQSARQRNSDSTVRFTPKALGPVVLPARMAEPRGTNWNCR